MSSGGAVAIPHSKLLRFVLLAPLVFVILGVTWHLADIQLRISRNGKVAQQLVESLEARFPGIRFRGAVSYEREVIYISVVNRLDEADREEVERWLREQQIEHRITPQIWLRLESGDPDKVVVIR
jgi:hypothetical protein